MRWVNPTLDVTLGKRLRGCLLALLKKYQSDNTYGFLLPPENSKVQKV